MAPVVETPPEPVQVFLLATNTGWFQMKQPNSGLFIEVFDFDGSHQTFSWPPQVLTDTERLTALNSCLEQLRPVVRSPDLRALTGPHFIRSAVMHCFKSSGMTDFRAIPGPGSSEYRIYLTTGNVNDSHAQPELHPFAAGGLTMGAFRHLQANGADPAAVAKDVTDCADQATRPGVSSTPDAPTPTSWQLTPAYRKVRPMLGRFDQCLRVRGYGVGDGS